MKDKIIDEKVVIDINTPEGRKFYEDMEDENYILFSGGRAKGKTYAVRRLQALEIIIEKKVQVGLLIHILNDENVIERPKTYQGNYFLYLYNSCCGELYGRLTEEEFDLLKEIF